MTPVHRILFRTVLACALTLGFASARAQQTAFQEPIPEQTVDPVIAPLVYQGGMVILRVIVKEDGSVAGIEVVKPFPALTDPVVAAVRQWRFTPARRDGRAVEATTTVAVHVVLMRTIVPR